MMRKDSNNMGVSEVVGYTTIFGLVLSTMTVALLGGVPTIVDKADTEIGNSVNRGFVTLDHKIDDVFLKDIPLESHSLNIGGGTINTGKDESGLVLSMGGSVTRRTNISHITYQGEREDVMYDSGAVFKKLIIGSGTEMSRGPGWEVSSDLVVVRVPDVSGGDSVAVSDGQAVDIEISKVPGSLVKTVPKGDTEVVQLSVTSRNSEIWLRYFERLQDENPSTVTGVSTVSSNTVSIELDIDSGQKFIYVEKPISVGIDV